MKNAKIVLLQDQMSSSTLLYTTPLSPMQMLLMMMMKKKGCALMIRILEFDQNIVHLLPLVYHVNYWV